jgi:hypothetical protein
MDEEAAEVLILISAVLSVLAAGGRFKTETIHYSATVRAPQGRYSITFFISLPFRTAIPVACSTGFPASPANQTTS